MIAIGYTGRANFAPPPVTQANDVVAARISAMSNHLPDARGKLNANDADNTPSEDREFARKQRFPEGRTIGKGDRIG
jgi:hypothetical protein